MNKTFYFPILIMILLIGNVSAYEWDNKKTYDPTTKTITFKDSLLGIPTTTIAEAQLNTPNYNYVWAGKEVQVAEFRTDLKEDSYEDFLKEMVFINLSSGKEISRPFVYKKKIITTKEFETFIQECKDTKDKYPNGTFIQECKDISGGKKTFDEVTWQTLGSQDDKIKIDKGNITIGLFTEVKKGDVVEWGMKMFGVTVIDVWATFAEQGFDTGLVAYFSFNNSVNNSGFGNVGPLIVFEGSPSFAGGISNGSGLVSNSNNWANGSTVGTTVFDNIGERTMNVWLKATSLTSGMQIFDKYQGGGIGWTLRAGATGIIDCNTDCAGSLATPASTLKTGAWTMITLTKNSTHNCLWVNGTLVVCATPVNSRTSTRPMHFGQNILDTSDYLGQYDENSWFNRSLSASEISALYNNHVPLVPTPSSGGGGTSPYFATNDLAGNTTISVGYTLNNNNSDANFEGIRIIPNVNLRLINVTTLATTNYCKITNDTNSNVTAEVQATSNVATFNYDLVSGTPYRIVCNGTLMGYSTSPFSSQSNQYLSITDQIYAGAVENSNVRRVNSFYIGVTGNTTGLNTSIVYTPFNSKNLSVQIFNSNGTAGIDFNGVNYSLSNTTTNVFNKSFTDLGAGTYPFYFWSYGSGSTYNTTAVYYYQISKNNTGAVTLTSTPTSPTTYGYNSTFSCTNTFLSGTQFFINGVDASSQNGVSTLRGAGTYSLNCTNAGTTNYSSSEMNSSYVINKNNASISILLNGAYSNTTTVYPVQSNGSGYAGNGTLAVHLDGVAVTSGANLTLGVGYHNYTAFAIGDTNYTTISKTLYVNITKGTPTLAIGITPSSTVAFPTETTATATGCPAELTCRFSRNDTAGFITSPNVTTYPVGVLNYTYNTTGNANYSATSTSTLLTVTSAPLVYPKWSSPSNTPSSPVTYVPSASYQFDIDWANAQAVRLNFSGVSYTPTNVAGNTWRYTFTDLSPGNYSYLWWANSSDGSMNQTVSSNYTINKAIPTGIISISPSTSVNYGVQTTATATETNLRDGDVVYKLYLDGSTAGVSNPDYKNLSVGTHVYIFNTTGGQNYSAVASLNSKTIIVTNTSISEYNVSYNSSTYETAYERFLLNITFDSTIYTVSSANFIYNGTIYYPAIKSYSGGASFLNALDIPTYSIPSTTSFYWTVNLFNGTAYVYFNSSSYNQTISTLNLSYCVSPFTNKVLNFTTYDADDLLLNTTLEALFDYYAGTGSVKKSYSYQSTLNQSQFVFCLNTTNNIYVDMTVSYLSNGYDRREHIVDGQAVNTTSPQNIPLVLALTTDTDIVTITVKDQNYNPISGALVTVQEWKIGTNTYPAIGMVLTNNAGSGIINLELYNVWYRAVVSYQGIIVKVTDVQKISETTWEITVDLEVDNPYSLFSTISHGLVFNNVTNVTTFTWLDSAGYAEQGCLIIRNLTSLGYDTISTECLTSVSGTINYQLANNAEYEIVGIVYLQDIYNVSSVTDVLYERLGTPDLTRTVSPFGKVISFIFIGTSASVGITASSPIWGIILLILSIFLSGKLGWLNITQAILWGLISIVIVLLFRIFKKNG